MLHCPDYKVTKTEKRKCSLTWAEPKYICDFVNYFWVAKAQPAQQLVKKADYHGEHHFIATTGMRQGHRGSFKIKGFQLFESIKKGHCGPMSTVPHLQQHAQNADTTIFICGEVLLI